MYGKQIREARLLYGATQIEVSKGTGIPQNTISWIELNKGIENIQQCVLLADFYGISIDELIGRKIPQNNGTTVIGSFNNNRGKINFKS